MADINGDGIDDVIANSNDTLNPYLVWYELPSNPYDEWKETIIADGIHGGVDPKGWGDLDNDGDVDIVRGNFGMKICEVMVPGGKHTRYLFLKVDRE